MEPPEDHESQDLVNLTFAKTAGETLCPVHCHNVSETPDKWHNDNHNDFRCFYSFCVDYGGTFISQLW